RRADLAEVMQVLNDQQRREVIRQLDSSSAGQVLSLLDEATRDGVVDDLSNRHLSSMVATLPPDDAADVLAELPPEQSEQVLDRMPDEHSRQVEGLMRHRPDTAGGLMTPALVAVPESATVSEAVVRLRQSRIAGELFYVYVVDEQGRLKGVVPLRRLVTAPPTTPVSQVMLHDLITVSVEQDQEQVANLFRKYDLAALPVVDQQGRLLGRITYDDVMDAADEEAEEDLLRMAGTGPKELETASPVRVAGVRATWLGACMLGTLITVAVAAFFKGKLDVEIFAVLAIFGPSIAAMSGNSGIQCSTLTIRRLATGGLAGQNLRRCYVREARVAGLLGGLFGVLAGLIARLVLPLLVQAGRASPKTPAVVVAGAVGGAMFLAIMFATTLGITLPFIFRRLGIDPAIASGPVVTTFNDSASWAMYLLLATIMVRVMS
ncbi:MAG: magnesium transporter, partial [Phycisphaerae bacterium]